MSNVRRAALLNCASMLVVALPLCATSAHAEEDAKVKTAWEASRETDTSDMVTTGVARKRDRLDSATSTSTLKDNEIVKLAPTSLADLFRNIPGIRVEAGAGEGLNNFTVRGLPLVNGGSKYLQLQEDGLPILEFGDLASAGPDLFLRIDQNVASVDSIRGGSASTFASNAPGGVVNLISKTGEVNGGSLQVSGGLNYDSNRVDFDYGRRMSDHLRFHVGGFFRQGEGPRETGYTALKGGQVKLNVTREFDGGYLRITGKYLDDRFPGYPTSPVSVSGGNDQPVFDNMPQFDAVKDTILSRNIGELPLVDTAGNTVARDTHQGFHVIAKSIGAELRLQLGEWTVTNRFRYADQSGQSNLFETGLALPAGALPFYFGGFSLRYANGSQAGTPVNPATVSGNGNAILTSLTHTDLNSLNNLTNDFRVSRVFAVGGGDLTTTAGLYKSRQSVDRDVYGAIFTQDIVGGGNSSALDVYGLFGNKLTNNGVLFNTSVTGMQDIDVNYDVLAPYGSLNFTKGKIAIGASIRYDRGNVSGRTGFDRVNGVEFTRPQDVNGDKALSLAELATPYIPSYFPVDYDYGYVSYSAGINYRVSPSFALFARHSLGGRAGADALLLSPALPLALGQPLNPATGDLANKRAGHDSVRQTEGGFKYRTNNVSFNVTGFYATTHETNVQGVPDVIGVLRPNLVVRDYRTYGVELEAGVRTGPLSIAGGATLTGGKITAAESPALVGKKPRHQAAIIYSVTPQYEIENFTLGVNVVGQTSSYAQDSNVLKMPGYVTVGAFVQLRPVERLVLGLNVSNLLDDQAIVAVSAADANARPITAIRTLYGRLVSTSARFFF